MRIKDLRGKRVAIWGYGKEGRSALKAVRRIIPELDIAILDDSGLSPGDIEGINSQRVRFITGAKAASSLSDFDVIIKSAGISRYRPEIIMAESSGVRFTSITRLWFAENPEKKTICITGTKGKSTTSALVAFMLRSIGVNAALGGNIGVPVLDWLGMTPAPDVYVMEMSSYQTSDFDGAPSVGVLLNLYPEHLDWHGSLDAYYRDKLNLFSNMEGGFKVINKLDEVASRFHLGGKVAYFNVPDGFHIRDDGIWEGEKFLMDAGEVALRGRHNLSNICAALTAIRCLGFDASKCLTAIPSFKGLPHRLTRLGERKGVLYVDDSISTTPQSAIAAINAFNGYPITILVGGFDRGLEWEEFARFLISKPLHALVTIPETGIKIARAVREAISLHKPAHVPVHREAADVIDAVRVAREITPPGGVVLLSPASPSYGAFKNFEERGRLFAKAAGFDYEYRYDLM